MSKISFLGFLVALPAQLLLAQTDIISNGGFESGSASWSVAGNPYFASIPANAHTGTRFLLVGNQVNTEDKCWQTISIPSNATSAVLTYWYNISRDNGTTNDPQDGLAVWIQDGSGNNLSLDQAWSGSSAGTPGVYSQRTSAVLNSYIGQTIRVLFHGSNDADATTTSFRIDDVSVVVTVTTVPTAPTNLLALAAGGTVGLSWADNSSNENGFRIERKTGSGGTYTEVATVGSNTTAYENSGLSTNQVYYYRTRAYNGGGNSAYSNEYYATTMTLPTSLSAWAVSTSQINMSWADNASGESGYKVERQPGGGGSWTEVAGIPANSTSYGDAGLTPGTSYTYRVRAYATSTVPTPHYSYYSNESGATTNPPPQTVSVSLSVTPGMGNAPLSAVLTATVSGSASGTINYTFWWNCNDPSTSVAYCTSVYGNPNDPAIGAKFDGTGEGTKSVTHSYQVAGTFTPKIIVERGTAQPAEMRASVQVGTGYPTPNLSHTAYTSGPFYDSPKLLIGQCTWFAYGRIQEVGSISLNQLSVLPNRLGSPGIFRGDAPTWLADAQSAGFATGTVPRIGSLAVWGVEPGHVAFVEAVNADNSILVSESNSTPAVGSDVVVGTESKLRSDHTTTAGVLWVIPKSTDMKVLSEPFVQDGFAWYQLQGHGYTGWCGWLEADLLTPANASSYWWNFTRIQLAPSPPFRPASPTAYIYLDSPVPVQLVSFAAHPISANRVLLEWKTASETNNYGFRIERRKDPEANFREVPGSFVAGHGTTIVPQDYSFLDSSAHSWRWWYRLKQIDLDGSTHLSDAVEATTVTSVTAEVPLEVVCSQNFPNPFNPSTTIRFGLPGRAHVSLTVHNTLGQQVCILVDGDKAAGYHEVKFDGKDSPSGVYFYRIQVRHSDIVVGNGSRGGEGVYVETRKLLLVR